MLKSYNLYNLISYTSNFGNKKCAKYSISYKIIMLTKL